MSKIIKTTCLIALFVTVVILFVLSLQPCPPQANETTTTVRSTDICYEHDGVCCSDSFTVEVVDEHEDGETIYVTCTDKYTYTNGDESIDLIEIKPGQSAVIVTRNGFLIRHSTLISYPVKTGETISVEIE